MTNYDAVFNKIERLLAQKTQEPAQIYQKIMATMLFSRIQTLAQQIVNQAGLIVQTGPFAGMSYGERAFGSCYIPKLLGCYEQELHGAIDVCLQQPIKRIINIGCAEGYYAMGLAKCLPHCDVFGFDTDQNAQHACRELANKNKVNITLDGTCTTDKLNKLIMDNSLIVCDCEGGEYDILNTNRLSPAYQHCFFIIETHQSNTPQHQSWLAKFEKTHDVTSISHQGRNPYAHTCLASLNQFDQWLCMLEFRSKQTPWVLLTPKDCV